MAFKPRVYSWLVLTAGLMAVVFLTRLNLREWLGWETNPAAQWRNMNYVDINRSFENVQSEFPAELLKAIAWCESEWRHWDASGQVFTGVNYKPKSLLQISYDYGIMQINNHENCLNREVWDPERIKNDPVYNIQASVEVMKAKKRYVHYLKHQPNWPYLREIYDLGNHNDLEITLKAYNGFKRSWSYPRRINRLMAEKPWEKRMLQQLQAEGKLACSGIIYAGGMESAILRTGWLQPAPAITILPSVRQPAFALYLDTTLQ